MLRLSSKEIFQTIVFYFEDENTEYKVIYSDSYDDTFVKEWSVETIDGDEVDDELKNKLIELAKLAK